MSKTETYEVSAWAATAAQAKTINDEQIMSLQESLGGTLAVERKQNGELILYSSDPSVTKRLDAMMTVLKLFRPQKIYVHSNKNE